MTASRTLLLSLLAAAVGLCAGCGAGDQGAKVSGTLLFEGKPYVPPGNSPVSIQFIPADAATKVPTCSAQPDPKTGAFDVVGPVVGQGMLPGKYKVVVEGSSYGGAKDPFGDQFSSRNTPLVYEVTADPVQKIVVDLGQKTVAKQ